MNRSRKKRFPEQVLQQRWENLAQGSEYFTECNRPLKVRSTGYRNLEAGPDFKNAGIVIDGETLAGDIEIHVKASDWFAHRHHHDPGYRQVVLHVVGENNLSQEKREQLPPMLVLKSRPVRRRDAAQSTGNVKGRCAAIIGSLGTEHARQLFIEAGLVRFRRKCDAMLEQMLLTGAEKGFLRCVFEAAGYKQNRARFLQLFERFSSYPDALREKNYPAILWGESGLLPDPAARKIPPPMRDLVKSHWEAWWSIRAEAQPAIRWRRSGVRPVNSPARRLAALLHYLDRFGENPLRHIHQRLWQEDISSAQLVKMFQISCELWDQHADFATRLKSPAAIAGAGFALELVVNIVLPAIHAAARLGYFECADNIAVMRQAERLWLQLPPTQENSVTRKAGNSWFASLEQKSSVLDTAAARQGVLQFWHEYCEPCQSDCASCRFFNSF